MTQQPQPAEAAVHAAPREREWFWRTLAALMLVMTGWMGWVAYQLAPTGIVMPAAFQALSQGRTPRNVQEGHIKPVVAAGAPPVAQSAVAPPPPQEPKKAPIDPEKLRLADTIETPVRKK